MEVLGGSTETITVLIADGRLEIMPVSVDQNADTSPYHPKP